MKVIAILYLLFCSVGVAYDQKWSGKLEIGDTLPGIEYRNFINAPRQSLHFSDYKDKIIILDFWNTKCGPCIAEFPRLFALQKQFVNQIQLVLVTYEGHNYIRDFLTRKNVLTHASSTVFITDDTILSQYFKPVTLPHDVWIGNGNRVLSISKSSYVNTNNINKVLSGAAVDWPVKNEDTRYNFKTIPIYNLSEFIENPTANPGFHTAVAPYVVGVSPGLFQQIDSINGRQRLNYYNKSLLSLYSEAYGFKNLLSEPKRCILKVKDTNRLFYSRADMPREEWESKNWLSYEAVVPLEKSRHDIERRMIDDLNLFTGYESAVEKRRIACWVIKDTGRSVFRSTGGEAYQHTLTKDSSGNYHYKQADANIRVLVDMLNREPVFNLVPFVISEVPLQGRVDLDIFIGTNVADFKSWNKLLSGYGYEVILEYRELDVLILSNTN